MSQITFPPNPTKLSCPKRRLQVSHFRLSKKNRVGRVIFFSTMHARWALASIGISNNSRSFAIKSASIMPAATVLEDTSFAADGLLPGTIAQGQVFWQLPHHPGKLLELELLFLAVFLSREGGKFMTPSFASCSSSCGISCRPVTQASQFKLNSFPCIRRMARWPQRRNGWPRFQLSFAFFLQG